MALLMLMPLFLDSLRVAFGVPFMSLFVVSLCLVVWLTKAFTLGKLDIQYSPVYFLLILIGATAFLSITAPIGNPVEKLYRAASFSYTRLFGVFLLVNFIRSLDQVRRTMYMVIGLGALSALVALWQFWIYEQTGMNYSFAQGDQMWRVTSAGSFLRATGLAADPNEIGINMAVAAVWCLYLGLSTEGVRPSARVAHYLLFLILVGGVIVTFSRSALLSLLIVLLILCLIFAFLHRPSWPRRLAMLCGVLGLGAVMASALNDSLSIFEGSSGDVLWRIDLNLLGLQAVLENPVTGVGVDAFIDYNNPYDLPVHNLFIQMASEMGLPGLFFLLILLVSLAIRLLAAAWRARDAGSRALFVALTLGYIVKLLSHSSNPMLTDLFFWFGVGLSEAAVMVRCADIPPRHEALGL